MEYKVILHDTVYTNDSFLDIPIDITKQVSIGASVVSKFAEELDIGRLNITHSLREKEYSMFSLIEIIIYKKKEEIKRYDMFIENDEVTPINKKGKRYYRHEIRLIELTHILDQSLINTLNFTQPLLGRHLAPFEQLVELYYEEDVPDPVGVWEPLDYSGGNPEVDQLAHKFTIIMDKPDIMNRYQGKVKISKVNKARLQFTTDSGEEDYQDFTIEDVELKVYFILQDAFGTYNEVLVPEYSTILSDNDFEEDMSRGRYRFELRTDGFVDSDSGESEFLRHIRRTISFYVGVDGDAYTMYDVINRIRSTSPIEKLSNLNTSRKFNINSELKERLEKIKAPQLLLKEITTREGLNEALKYVNSVCRLINIGSVYEIVENHFNTRNEPYEIGNIFAFSSEKNTLEYSTSLRSYLKRNISNNSNDTASVKTPSAKDFEGYRSETLQILPDTPKIFLSEPIYRLINVTARITYNLPFYGGQISEDRIVKDIEIDLTPRVIEKREFNLRRAKVFITSQALLGAISMPRKSFLRDTQGEFATYDYLGKEIDFTPKGVDLVGFFPAPYFIYILTAGLYEEMAFMQGRNALSPNFKGTVSPPPSGTGDTLFMNTYTAMPPWAQYQSRFFGDTDEERVSNIELRVEYITMSNTVQSSQRENTETMFVETVKKINQNSRITNFEKTTKQAYGLAQRYGVQTINFSKLTKYPKSLPEPGDFNENNELIVEQEMVFHKNHVIGKFEASRDFNRFSKYVGIDREYRYSEIPDPTVSEDRVEIYEEFLEYYTGQIPDFIENDTYISSLFTETMVNTVVQNPDKNKTGISNALIRTDGTKENYPDVAGVKKYITLSTVSMGGKNLLSFGFRFNDSRIAGDIVDFNDIYGIIDDPYGLWQEYVEYTKIDGTFDTLDFNLVSGIPQNVEDTAYERTRKLPLIEYNPGTAIHQMSDIRFASTDNTGIEDPLMIFKDQGERFGLVYQVSFVPKNKEAREDIIFGTNFTSFNFLVNGNQEEKYLYAYDNGTEYFKFDDQRIKSGFSSKTNLNNIEPLPSILYVGGMAVGLEVALPVGTTSWAIGNDNGDLDIANNTTSNNIIFVPRNKRRDVLTKIEPTKLFMVSLDGSMEIDGNVSVINQPNILVSVEGNIEMGGQVSVIKQPNVSVNLSGDMTIGGNIQYTTQKDASVNLSENMTIGGSVQYITQKDRAVSLTGNLQVSGTVGLPEQTTTPIIVIASKNYFSDFNTSNINMSVENNDSETADILYGTYLTGNEGTEENVQSSTIASISFTVVGNPNSVYARAIADGKSMSDYDVWQF